MLKINFKPIALTIVMLPIIIVCLFAKFVGTLLVELADSLYELMMQTRESIEGKDKQNG